MKPAQGWSSWKTHCCLVLALAAGCTPARPHVREAILADKGSPMRNEGVADNYLVGCPDVLEITVQSQPDLSGRKTIGIDGRIAMGNLGQLRVEKRTVPE